MSLSHRYSHRRSPTADFTLLRPPNAAHTLLLSHRCSHTAALLILYLHCCSCTVVFHRRSPAHCALLLAHCNWLGADLAHGCSHNAAETHLLMLLLAHCRSPSVLALLFLHCCLHTAALMALFTAALVLLHSHFFESCSSHTSLLTQLLSNNAAFALCSSHCRLMLLLLFTLWFRRTAAVAHCCSWVSGCHTSTTSLTPMLSYFSYLPSPSRCCSQAVDFTLLLLSHCCFLTAALSLLLSHCCSRTANISLLLSYYCSLTTAFSLLLSHYKAPLFIHSHTAAHYL